MCWSHNVEALKHFLSFLATSKQDSVAESQLFKLVPISPSKQNLNKERDREQIYKEFADVLPNGCFVAFFEKDETAGQENAASEDGTSSELAENIVITFAKSCSTTEEFITNIPAVSDQEIAKIENETIGQSVNSAWLMQRKGRITASNFYAVYTKVNSLRSETVISKWLNAEPLIKRLMGYEGINPDLPSLKHGRFLSQ